MFATNHSFSSSKTNAEAAAASSSQKRQQRYNVPALWRSAILPSWGQFYVGYKVKGYTIASLEVLSLGMVLGSYFYFQSLYDDFLQAPVLEKIPDLKLWNNINHISLAVFGLTYLYNLADAYFFSSGHFFTVSLSYNEWLVKMKF